MTASGTSSTPGTGEIPPEAIDGSFVPVRKGSVASSELDGEAVLLDTDTGSVHLLDSIGSVVWSCFDGSATLAELARDLAEAFSAEPDRVYSDVLALARQLGRQGLLVGVLATHVSDEPGRDGR